MVNTVADQKKTDDNTWVTWEAIMLITVKMHLIPMQLHGIRQVYSTL